MAAFRGWSSTITFLLNHAKETDYDLTKMLPLALRRAIAAGHPDDAPVPGGFFEIWRIEVHKRA